MITITWPDGRQDSAPTWEALLAAINGLEWNRHLDPVAFREELARRALVWCGEHLVDPEAPLPTFFAQLQASDLLTITVHTPGA